MLTVFESVYMDGHRSWMKRRTATYRSIHGGQLFLMMNRLADDSMLLFRFACCLKRISRTHEYPEYELYDNNLLLWKRVLLKWDDYLYFQLCLVLFHFLCELIFFFLLDSHSHGSSSSIPNLMMRQHSNLTNLANPYTFFFFFKSGQLRHKPISSMHRSCLVWVIATSI